MKLIKKTCKKDHVEIKTCTACENKCFMCKRNLFRVLKTMSKFRNESRLFAREVQNVTLLLGLLWDVIVHRSRPGFSHGELSIKLLGKVSHDLALR